MPLSAIQPAASAHGDALVWPVTLAGRRVHFLGIGGCGMSGLARMARHHGARCSGADMRQSPTVAALMEDGFDVEVDARPGETIPDHIDLLVVSAAIGPNHPQVIEARRRGIKTLKYAQLLGQLMIGRRGVAVAGTHGKSTTTSILSHILIQAELDPSFIVGAQCDQIGGGSRCGQSDILVAEACEFDRSFHNFHPTHAVILNVEADHLDMYASLEEIVEAFAVFARRLPAASEGGRLLINDEMACRPAITAGLDCQMETLGFSNQANWRVEIMDGRVRLHHDGQIVAAWRNPLPGRHMAYNAAAAAILAHRLGAAWQAIVPAVEGFTGLDRRMQLVGTKGPRDQGTEGKESHHSASSAIPTSHIRHPKSEITSSLDPWAPRSLGPSITVIDDYGHHPTEIDATLSALREHYQPARLICVFQPHQHSRTRFLMEQFTQSFSQADIVIVPEIYFVRDSENERHAVTATDLVARLQARGVEAMYLHPFEAIVEELRRITRAGDMVVTMGAGDVWKVARQFVS